MPMGNLWKITGHIGIEDEEKILYISVCDTCRLPPEGRRAQWMGDFRRIALQLPLCQNLGRRKNAAGRLEVYQSIYQWEEK